jgi:hypothetical protein
MTVDRALRYLSIFAGIVHLVFLLFIRVPLGEFVDDQFFQCAFYERAWLESMSCTRKGMCIA